MQLLESPTILITWPTPVPDCARVRRLCSIWKASTFCSLCAGAGEPNFDSYVANPYASLRERREGEVAALLDKLQPNTIVLDPNTIGR